MQRRTYLKAVGGSVVALPLAGCTGGGGGGSTPTSSATTIIPGTAPGFPPFEMNQSGELVGFDVDLLSAVVDAADGYQLGSWQSFDFDSLIPALTSGKIDVVAAAMTITAERDQTIDFSDPYYSADQAVLVRANGDFQPTQLSDLAGHKVGSQSGTTGEGIVQGLIKDGTLAESDYNSYDSYVFAVEDLQNGNIDAVVLDVPVANTFADQRPVAVAFVHQTGERYGFGIRDGETDLQSALNAGLSAVQDSGQYDQIRNQWFGGSNG